MFGLTGGLIPCPASITVLLLCLQLKKIALGATLVLGFSVGLALTMVAVRRGRGAGRQAPVQADGGLGRLSELAAKAPYLSGGADADRRVVCRLAGAARAGLTAAGVRHRAGSRFGGAVPGDDMARSDKVPDTSGRPDTSGKPAPPGSQTPPGSLPPPEARHLREASPPRKGAPRKKKPALSGLSSFQRGNFKPAPAASRRVRPAAPAPRWPRRC